MTQMCFGHSVYTTESSVRFAVIAAGGGFGELVVDHLAPGETKIVMVNDRRITIYRLRLGASVPDHGSPPDD